MNILWHHRPSYNSPETSGSNLRLLNLIRELEIQGHRVYLLLDDLSGSDDSFRDSWVNAIKKSGAASGVFYGDFTAVYSPVIASIARKLLYPAIVNALLRPYHERMFRQLAELISEHKINAFVTSMRDRLWVIPFLDGELVTVVDWCDSNVLACMRELRLGWSRRELHDIPAATKALALGIAQESYYGRLADVNLLSSPIDAKCFTRFARKPEKTHVLPNGVAATSSGPMQKINKRLIFSGRMDFPPNHEAAIWFIDFVLPILLEKDCGTEFVIAGANPLPELLSRASANVNVLGFVENMGAEIAASVLYVAPMRSGSGFKNKVAEAIVNGTFVAGTPLAFEFLEKEIRELLLVGKSPIQLASQILRFLADPKSYDKQLDLVRELVSERFQWATQAKQLIHLIEEVRATTANKASTHYL